MAGKVAGACLTFEVTAKLFSKNVYAVLHHQGHCVRTSVTPYPCQHLLWSAFLILAIPIGV